MHKIKPIEKIKEIFLENPEVNLNRHFLIKKTGSNYYTINTILTKLVQEQFITALYVNDYAVFYRLNQEETQNDS